MYLWKRIICKTTCSQINFPVFLMFCLGCCLAFPYFFEIFKTSVVHKGLAYHDLAWYTWLVEIENAKTSTAF